MKTGWAVEPLGDLCDILDSMRKPVTKKDRVAGEIPYYGATGIQDYVAAHLFDEPLVLVGEDGAKWGAGENTAFAVSGKCWVNNHAHVLRPDRNKVVDNWLIYYLNATDLNEYVSGLTVPKLNQGNLRQITIPVPPLPEQRRIVAILDEAFEGIAAAKANAEQNLLNAKEVFASIAAAAINQQAPEWHDTVLGKLAVVDWGNTDLTKKAYTAEGKYLAVSAAGCDGRIGHAEHRAFTPVLSAIGAQCGRMFMPEEDFTAIKNTITLTPNLDICDGWFLFHLLRTKTLPKRGAAQPFIAKGDVVSFPVSVPSAGEQRVIAARLRNVQKYATVLEKNVSTKLASLDELKASLLHQAFTGQL